MEKIKAIADRYKVQKTLFKVNNYLYARSNLSPNLVFDKHTLDTVFGCVVSFLHYSVRLRKLITRTNTQNATRKVLQLQQNAQPNLSLVTCQG